MNKTVAAFRPLVDFLATVLGSNSEVVLHDFSDPAHSVVEIRNGYVSGRQAGAPATDFALKVLAGEAFAGKTHTPVYVAHSVSGKPLRSASYFIREGERLVGMLCVNTDTSAVEGLVAAARAVAQTAPTLADALDAGSAGAGALRPDSVGADAANDGAPDAGAEETAPSDTGTVDPETLDADAAELDFPAAGTVGGSSADGGAAKSGSPAARFTYSGFPGIGSPRPAPPRPNSPAAGAFCTSGRTSTPTASVLEAAGLEHFSTTAEELVATTIAQIAAAKGCSVASFSPTDRLDVVRRLNADGVFLLKGAVAHVAATLGISEPSVYRYLQKVRRAG